MKKLLFVVAIATIGLTTSCSKSCDTCSLDLGVLGKQQVGKTKAECDAAIEAAKTSGLSITCD
jgi:hypothetical protein